MNEFKKITIKSIYDLLNSSFPIANQEIWDQSGLRLFDLKSTPISKIINIKDKIANSVGRYIVDNKDRLDIDTNTECYIPLKDFCENNDRCLEDYIYNDDSMMDDVYEAIRDDVNYNGDIDLTVERVR